MDAVNSDVDSFSTIFMPTIPISEVTLSTLPISYATPIFTTEQYENLGNVFDDFPTLTEGQVSQLDTSIARFEMFMTKSSQRNLWFQLCKLKCALGEENSIEVGQCSSSWDHPPIIFPTYSHHITNNLGESEG